MISNLHDPHLNTMLADADPVDIDALRHVITGAGAGAGAHCMRDAITAQPTRSFAGRHRRRLSVLAVAAVAAVATPLAMTALTPSSHDSAYAASAVHLAHHSPRFLLRAQGWRVSDLNQYSADEGETFFQSGKTTLDVEWDTPADAFTPGPGDMTSPQPVTIDGHRALVGRVPAPGARYYVAEWSTGGFGVRVRGPFPDRAAFLAVVQTLHRVDVPTWLAALPKTVVTPAGRKNTITAMLADIPQPPGFDPTTLDHSTLLLDRYQLGAHVTTAVGCGWLTLWLHGTAGERAAASTAMASSRHWAILREMAPQGGWSQSFWDVADNMNGTPLRGLAPGQTEAEILRNHLGC